MARTAMRAAKGTPATTATTPTPATTPTTATTPTPADPIWHRRWPRPPTGRRPATGSRAPCPHSPRPGCPARDLVLHLSFRSRRCRVASPARALAPDRHPHPLPCRPGPRHGGLARAHVSTSGHGDDDSGSDEQDEVPPSMEDLGDLRN